MRRSKKSLGSAILVSLLSASMVMTTPVSVFAKTFVENQTETIEGDVNDGIEAPAKSDVTVKGSVNVRPNSREHLDADHATVKVTGDVNTFISANNGASVTVGGDVKDGVSADNNSTVTVGGSVNEDIDASQGADVAVNKNVNGNVIILDGKVSIAGNVSCNMRSTAGAIESSIQIALNA